jgi:TldD protein
MLYGTPFFHGCRTCRSNQIGGHVARDLAGGVERGILIRGRQFPSTSHNFQFGGQTFREIVKGKIGGMLRDVAYQSRTTDFWQACDGLGGPETYRLGGAFNDGKGEPAQLSRVSHGAPVARFRGVNVLNTGAS